MYRLQNKNLKKCMVFKVIDFVPNILINNIHIVMITFIFVILD